MIETIAFSFSIMAVIPGISSTLSISLPAGQIPHELEISVFPQNVS